MKTPEKIKKGLEYISTTNIARKVAIAKAGRMPYEYAEEAAADALSYIRELEAKVAELDKRCEANALNASMAIRELEEAKLRCLEQIKVYVDKLAEYEKPLRPLPEVEIYGHEPVWLEMRAECDEPRIVDIVPSFVNPAERAEIAFIGQDRRAHLRIDHYGNSWRCWSRRPTEEERKAAEWDD